MRDILDLTPAVVMDRLSSLGCKAFRARQVLDWIYDRGVRSFDEMTNLPKDLRVRLAESFCIGSGEVEQVSRAASGKTTKLLFRYGDGECVEAVSMVEGKRHSACLSCQVGCAMGCAFCATGGLGFKRNLTTGEMLQQMLEIARAEGMPNRVVFMGMGEPLLNLPAVLGAVEGLMDEDRFALGGRRITLSTCGITPGILELADRDVPVRLALSLNSASQEQRETLMPIAKKHPIDEVVNACEDYMLRTGRRVLLEYVLLGGVNTSRTAAAALGRLAMRLDAKVNLIQYNPVPGSPYAPPTKEETASFCVGLEKKGVTVIVRYRRGRDIEAGCGQLAAKAR